MYRYYINVLYSSYTMYYYYIVKLVQANMTSNTNNKTVTTYCL